MIAANWLRTLVASENDCSLPKSTSNAEHVPRGGRKKKERWQDQSWADYWPSPYPLLFLFQFGNIGLINPRQIVTTRKKLYDSQKYLQALETERWQHRESSSITGCPSAVPQQWSTSCTDWRLRISLKLLLFLIPLEAARTTWEIQQTKWSCSIQWESFKTKIGVRFTFGM